MSQPQISQRCPHCGVALRVKAIFCPQCGKPLYDPGPESTDSKRPPDELLNDPDAHSEFASSALKSHASVAPLPSGNSLSDSSATAKVENTTEGQGIKPRFQITASVPPQKLDKLRPGMEKVRTASNIVFNEASYDPTLRFVIVAAVLFLAALVLVVVSHFIE